MAEAKLAINGGYKVTSFSDTLWLANLYGDNGDFKAAVPLYEQAVQLKPNDTQLLGGLAYVYAQSGDKQKALDIAYKMLQMDPSLKDQVDAFIKSLQ